MMSFARDSNVEGLPLEPPSITVIVTSADALEALRGCLRSIDECRRVAGAEVMVVRAGLASDVADIAREFPESTYVIAPPETTRMQLRRIGLLQSTRRILFFVDDVQTERHGWTVELCRRSRQWDARSGRVASGGRGASRAAMGPFLSVVIPVHNGGESLLLALEALELSDLDKRTWELVIVDDASTDETALTAVQYADRLVRLPGKAHGPGYARNRGFEVTLGACVTFLNADVMVHSDTLSRAVRALIRDNGVGAVFGTNDSAPLAKGLVSQYGNLLQRYRHERHAGEASTFASACGTVWSVVFEEAGGYDEWHFARQQLEDLEIGQRIRQLGRRIVLDPEIRSTNLKRWTLRTLILTEIFDRAVPWMRLVDRRLSRERQRGRSLLRAKKVNIVLTWLAVVLASLASLAHRSFLLDYAATCLGLVVAINAKQLAFFTRARGLPFALATVPLDITSYFASGIGMGLGWIARQTVGDPRPGPSAEAFAEMPVRRWPPAPTLRALDAQKTPPEGTSVTLPAETAHLPATTVSTRR